MPRPPHASLISISVGFLSQRQTASPGQPFSSVSDPLLTDQPWLLAKSEGKTHQSAARRFSLSVLAQLAGTSDAAVMDPRERYCLFTRGLLKWKMDAIT